MISSLRACRRDPATKVCRSRCWVPPSHFWTDQGRKKGLQKSANVCRLEKITTSIPQSFQENISTIRYMYKWYTLYTFIYIYIRTLHHITSHHITSHHITSHCIALHCIALHYIALHCIALHYITLHINIHTSSKECLPASFFRNPRRLTAAPWASPASEARSHSAGPPHRLGLGCTFGDDVPVRGDIAATWNQGQYIVYAYV